MKLAEVWHLSRIPYKEVVYQSLAEEKGRMWWGAFGTNRSDKDAANDLELTKRALRIAKFDKTMVSSFNIIVSIAPFVMSFLGIAAFGLTSSIALSLAVTFGLTTLYAIQTLSSFVRAESSPLLSTLPITQEDFSLITLFSFVRSVDYMVVGSLLSQITIVAIVSMNAAATIITLFAASINQLFAVTVALWFSEVFQKNLFRGGRSKSKTLLRLVFILMWGLLLVGVGSLFSIPWYILPNLENALLGAGQMSTLLLSVIYPFSTGILIGSITYSNIALTTVIISSVAMVAYSLLAILAAKWNLKTVKSISHNSGTKITRATAKDFSVKPRRPLTGYVLKDLKVASRNPATAFFFALPVLETLIIALLISNLETLRTSAILVATSMGAIFSLLMPLALLTAEGKGLEFTKTLPITSFRIVVSKTLISTATYVLVPMALTAFILIKPLAAPSAIIIPFLITASVASASIFEIKLFLKTTGKNKINAIINDMQKLIIGVITILIPQVFYAIIFLSSFNHYYSILAMAAIVFAELTTAVYLLRSSGANNFSPKNQLTNKPATISELNSWQQ
jgi:predicted permease